MKIKLNTRNLTTIIVIGGTMAFILGIIGLKSIEDMMILLILFPVGIVALTIVVWIQIYLTEKIKEDALIDRE